MPIKSPNERVYYYECSYGTFRLTYYIPYEDLEKLCKEGKISEQALIDFPDGVDLRVGETDYMDFKKSYGYRPEVDPELARSLFYTIYSSTKNWTKFRGSDLIPARDLEGTIGDIAESVKSSKNRLLFDLIKTPLTFVPEEMDKTDLKRYRMNRKKYSNNQKKVDNFLKKIKPEGIDSAQTLLNQKFSKIQWTKGDNLEDVYARIQKKKKMTIHDSTS